ncbi:MAG: hypothetical protein R3192_03430 [Woeseiaceae bacterium]|nr:hypothetical protein [Woeseiaceae bacterium]
MQRELTTGGLSPVGRDDMEGNWPAILRQLALEAHTIFLKPGAYLLSRLDADSEEIFLTTLVAALLWSLLAFVAFKALKSVVAEIFYAGRRTRTFLLGKLQKANRRRRLKKPVEVPDVDIDDLDIAILNTGLTLPPGLALTAAELAGQLTRRPAQLQQRLEKLRKYGLVDGALGETDGFDNYRLTRSGAAVVSMLHREHGFRL